MGETSGMREDQHRFLSIHGKLPARLTAEQAAWMLGFADHEITILMGTGLIKPLGRPMKTCVKYFASAELEELRKDTRWLAKATNTIMNYWQVRNAAKQSAPATLT